MQTFIIKGKKLKNWKSFHSEFKKEMNFPEYYGENMNAWIDCVHELTDEPTILQINNGKYLRFNAYRVDRTGNCGFGCRCEQRCCKLFEFCYWLESRIDENHHDCGQFGDRNWGHFL